MAESVVNAGGPAKTEQELREMESAQQLLQEAETWESWESKLVGYSISLGIVGLIVLGWLVNTFLLVNHG